MGNQNTSGIIEERAGNRAVENGKNVNSEQELGKENREDETKNLQEDNGGPDFDRGNQADQTCPFELKGEANGLVNENRETQMDGLPDGLSSNIEVKESNLAEGVLVNNNGMDDPSCKSEGETPENDIGFELEPNHHTSSITNSRSLPHEDVGMASEPQTDKSMVVEIEEAQGFENSCQIEAESHKVDTKFTQDLNTSKVSATDGDHDVEKSKDEYIVDDTASDEASLETRMDEEEPSKMTGIDNTRNVVGDERGKEEEDTRDNQISVLDSSAGEDEKASKFLTQGEEKPMLDEEITEALNMSMQMVETDVKGRDGGEPVIETGSIYDDETKPKDKQDERGLCDNDSLKNKHEDPDQLPDQTEEGLTVTVENEEDNQPTDEYIIEHNTVITSIKKGQVPLQSQSTVEINADPPQLEPALNDGSVPNIVSEPEIPPCSTTEISQGFGLEPKLRDTGMQVMLRKSPSFDFGIVPYDARSDESDQTPLLYNDRSAAPRRVSSCSTLGFQSVSVQTEYLENSLQYEAEEVEEKTIQMEKSNSESLRMKTVALPNNDEKVNVNVKSTQQDCDLVSPKGTRKKKMRSSLFTTCICCTEAIS